MGPTRRPRPGQISGGAATLIPPRRSWGKGIDRGPIVKKARSFFTIAGNRAKCGRKILSPTLLDRLDQGPGRGPLGASSIPPLEAPGHIRDNPAGRAGAVCSRIGYFAGASGGGVAVSVSIACPTWTIAPRAIPTQAGTCETAVN